MTENNRIPTVNRNLTSPQVILDHAPAADATPFDTIGLKTVDRVMEHLGEAYMAYEDDPLKLLIHEFHMQSMWHFIEKQYSILKAEPPAGLPLFCECAKEVNRNGVMKYLNLFASLVYRNKDYKEQRWNESLPLEDCPTEACKVELKIGIINRPVGLSTKQAWMKNRHLLLDHFDQRDYREIAIFLYCMLET